MKDLRMSVTRRNACCFCWRHTSTFSREKNRSTHRCWKRERFLNWNIYALYIDTHTHTYVYIYLRFLYSKIFFFFSFFFHDKNFTVCNFIVHEKCVTNVVTPCSGIAPFLIKNPVAHCWSEPTHHKRRFCTVCRKRLDEVAAVHCMSMSMPFLIIMNLHI